MKFFLIGMIDSVWTPGVDPGCGHKMHHEVLPMSLSIKQLQ